VAPKKKKKKQKEKSGDAQWELVVLRLIAP
jgi:hypothetical protein